MIRESIFSCLVSSHLPIDLISSIKSSKLENSEKDPDLQSPERVFISKAIKLKRRMAERKTLIYKCKPKPYF